MGYPLQWQPHARSGARLGALVDCRDRPLLVGGRTVCSARSQRPLSLPWCAGKLIWTVSSVTKVSRTGQRAGQTWYLVPGMIYASWHSCCCLSTDVYEASRGRDGRGVREIARNVLAVGLLCWIVLPLLLGGRYFCTLLVSNSGGGDDTVRFTPETTKPLLLYW